LRVLIIPEDFTFDQYILLPIIQAMFRNLGKPTAKIAVCQDPRLGGVDQATSWERIRPILEQYGMVNLFLLCVDRDGIEGRQQRLYNLEQQANDFLGNNRHFLAVNAWQEIEVWTLAGHDLSTNWDWQIIRDDNDPKEHFFLPFAEQRGVANSLENAYRTLSREAASRYGRITQLCPELAELESRIRDWMIQNP
jgi:hypothetical protein